MLARLASVVVGPRADLSPTATAVPRLIACAAWSNSGGARKQKTRHQRGFSASRLYEVGRGVKGGFGFAVVRVRGSVGGCEVRSSLYRLLGGGLGVMAAAPGAQFQKCGQAASRKAAPP